MSLYFHLTTSLDNLVKLCGVCNLIQLPILKRCYFDN